MNLKVTAPRNMRDFGLEVFFSKWEFTARHHMTASDLESMSLSDLLAMASNEDRNAFEELWLGYTETWGAPQLRREISSTYNQIPADNILCMAGAGEGLEHESRPGGRDNHRNGSWRLYPRRFPACPMASALDAHQGLRGGPGGHALVHPRSLELVRTNQPVEVLMAEFIDAHDAIADVRETVGVWRAQCELYGLNVNDREELHTESNWERQNVDLAGKIIVGPDGRPTYNIGKAKGTAVEDDKGFGRWMLDKDFTENTKMHLRKILKINERHKTANPV